MMPANHFLWNKIATIFTGFFLWYFFSTFSVAANPGIIDGHNHLFWQGGGRRSDFNASYAAESALMKMNEDGISFMLLMPPPFPMEHRGSYDLAPLLSVTRKFPNRFAILGGGGSLNPLLQRTVKNQQVTQEDIATLTNVAINLADDKAVGFGEIGLLHLALGPNHNFHAAPADHPLMLALADIAAERGLPIDIHMEAVEFAMSLPPRLAEQEVNPRHLENNIAAFERLLSHNKQAKIIWAHAGWDNTGQRTTDLMTRLLASHPNLYMSLKISPQDSEPATSPIRQNGEIKEEWLKLFRLFPERFYIGTDQFYTASVNMRIGPQRTGIMMEFIKQLPDDLFRAMTYDNAVRLFDLNR